MDVFEAERLTDELVSAELFTQNRTWGSTADRHDNQNGEFQLAGMAQLDALFDRQNGEPGAFDHVPEIYPETWSGFRDYGSDIANLVVAVAFLTQEIKRKLMNDEDHTRLARTAQQAYAADAPLAGS